MNEIQKEYNILAKDRLSDLIGYKDTFDNIKIIDYQKIQDFENWIVGFTHDKDKLSGVIIGLIYFEYKKKTQTGYLPKKMISKEKQMERLICKHKAKIARDLIKFAQSIFECS